jgi:hypothetical protein
MPGDDYLNSASSISRSAENSLFDTCGGTGEQRRQVVMRASIKRSLTGFLVAGALVFGVAGAEAMGGGNANGPDAYIGIIGGSPNAYPYSSHGYAYSEGGYQANSGGESGHAYQHGHGSHSGYGTYNGGYYHGY